MNSLQIIPELCQTPHIIHHWKEYDISDDNDNDKDTHKAKDKYKDKETMKKTKCLKDPSHGHPDHSNVMFTKMCSESQENL